MPTEHFIPIRAAHLVRLLLRQARLPTADLQAFQTLADRVVALYQRRSSVQLEDFLEDYAPFDPDQDLIYERRDGRSLQALRGERFSQQLAEYLRTANYLQLQQADLERSLELSVGWSVRYSVDFDAFDLLQVHVRGVRPMEVSRRLWLQPWKKQTRSILRYQRVVIAFRVKPNHRLAKRFDPDRIYLKIFKEMPETEVDMMMPGSQVKFSWMDRGRIFLPAIGGLFAGMRLAKAVVIWGPRISLFLRFVALTSLLKWVGGSTWFADWALNETGDGLNLTGWAVAGILALIFYFVRYWTSHNRTAREHQNLLTANLYLRNLGNNASVLFQVAEDAKEQELRELLLGYFLLWQDGGPEGWTMARLDEQAQSFLRRQLKQEVDFEVDDSLRKLKLWDLVTQSSDGHWHAVPITTAVERLGLRLHTHN